MTHEPLVIAHRGASAGVTDNSLPAFEKAIAVGADAIEFDVRRTCDDQLIVFHDDEVAGVPIGALRRPDLDDLAGYPPPLLTDVLDLARGRIKLDIELKEDGYVEEVLSDVRARFEPEELLITSFLDPVVAKVKRFEPEIKAGLLLGVDKPEHYLRTRVSEVFPVRRALRVGADYLAPHFKLARLGVLKRAARAGLPTLVWTLNEDAEISEFLSDDRVAGLITDIPERAIALRTAARSNAGSRVEPGDTQGRVPPLSTDDPDPGSATR